VALKLKQVEMSPSRIDPAQNNPNRMEPERYSQLVEAIKRFGFLQPVLVRPHPTDKHRFIACDGHHRIQAALEAGLTSIPVIVGNMTDAEADALQVAMNRLRGELDLSATASILDSLRAAGWSAVDLGGLGFSLEEVGDLLGLLTAEPEIMPEAIEGSDDAPEQPHAFVLEVEFDSAEQMKVAKRALRRAAGKGQPLGHGLLKLLGDD
jgi:ParB/RepB/Spo0J family partition protein